MSLLTDRTLPLTLLLILMTGSVTTATAHRLTCQQEIPAGLIRDLWSRTKQLNSRLPKEERFTGKLRLLPKFCTRCSRLAIGWLEMREVIDVYQRSVFGTEVAQKLLPLHFNDLLYRLQHTLEHCVSSLKPSGKFKFIKKLERKIKKRRTAGVMKAIGEFTFILRWIDELTQHNAL